MRGVTRKIEFLGRTRCSGRNIKKERLKGHGACSWRQDTVEEGRKNGAKIQDSTKKKKHSIDVSVQRDKKTLAKDGGKHYSRDKMAPEENEGEEDRALEERV